MFLCLLQAFLTNLCFLFPLSVSYSQVFLDFILLSLFSLLLYIHLTSFYSFPINLSASLRLLTSLFIAISTTTCHNNYITTWDLGIIIVYDNVRTCSDSLSPGIDRHPRTTRSGSPYNQFHYHFFTSLFYAQKLAALVGCRAVR